MSWQSGAHQCPRDFHKDAGPRQTRDCFQEKFDGINVFEKKLQMLVRTPARSWGNPSRGRLQTLQKHLRVDRQWSVWMEIVDFLWEGPGFHLWTSALHAVEMSPLCLVLMLNLCARDTSPTITLRNAASARRSVVPSVGIWLWELATDCCASSKSSAHWPTPNFPNLAHNSSFPSFVGPKGRRGCLGHLEQWALSGTDTPQVAASDVCD